jgi:hypothetical protein
MRCGRNWGFSARLASRARSSRHRIKARFQEGPHSLFQSRNEPEGLVCGGQLWTAPFGMISYIARDRRGGGNVGIGFIDFQGLWEGRKTALSFSDLSINRHFHGPLPLRPRVHAHFPICSNMVFLACCMRRAASVSLMVAATRLSAATVNPGRRNCCGRSSESSFSSGVCHSL